MGETPETLDLPEGYRLDLLGDPDAPALRRPDGTVVARFAARGLRREGIEREALEDLMGASRERGRSTYEVHELGPLDRGSARRRAHPLGIIRKSE